MLLISWVYALKLVNYPFVIIFLTNILFKIYICMISSFITQHTHTCAQLTHIGSFNVCSAHAYCLRTYAQRSPTIFLRSSRSLQMLTIRWIAFRKIGSFAYASIFKRILFIKYAQCAIKARACPKIIKFTKTILNYFT
jgi:hypothetical protein